MRTATDPTDIDSAPTVVSPQGRQGATPGSGRPLAGGPGPLAPRGMGLSTQFFLAAALLLVATLGAALSIATWRANQIAERSISEALREIPRAVAAARSGLDVQLRATLRSIAEEPGTKALFSSNAVTAHEWAVTKAGILGARTVFLFDPEGALICRSDKPAGTDQGKSFRGARWVAEPIETLREASASIREGDVLAAVAAVPVVSGDPARGEARLTGIVAASIPLDARQAQALRGLTGGQVTYVADVGKRGDPPTLALSATTDPVGGRGLVAALAANQPAVAALFGGAREIGPLDLDVDGDRRIVKAFPVASASGEVLGAVVVSRSREEETAAFRRIRDTLLLIGLLALVVSVPVSFALGRRIARPLEQLASGAIAIRDGNLDVRLPEGGAGEVGTLARAFVAMVEDLREKAQLEEMIGEMRRRRGGDETVATVVPPSAEPAASTEAPVVGQTFAGRYQVLDVLGKGGMGAVYRVLDRELDEEVALKVLTSAAAGGGQEVQTIKQEIRLARKITHSNVVRTHDLGEAQGLRFLTMEYVPGTTLREVMDRRRYVALAPGLQIAKQLCRGLGAVHEAGIIHRDIKPQNIMVLPSGVVKLMDFGIARAAEGVDLAAIAGLTVGTPFYMSPEQALGKQLDARSDLYSVGVVLFELFCGMRPFEARDPVEAMKKHISAEPPRPTDLRPDLPELLERILLACLAKPPASRPATASDLLAALQRVAA